MSHLATVGRNGFGQKHVASYTPHEFNACFEEHPPCLSYNIHSSAIHNANLSFSTLKSSNSCLACLTSYKLRSIKSQLLSRCFNPFILVHCLSILCFQDASPYCTSYFKFARTWWRKRVEQRYRRALPCTRPPKARRGRLWNLGDAMRRR
jgi:hypothetical protein